MACNCRGQHAPGCRHKNVEIEKYEVNITNYEYPIDRFEEVFNDLQSHRTSGDHDSRYVTKEELLIQVRALEAKINALKGGI